MRHLVYRLVFAFLAAAITTAPVQKAEAAAPIFPGGLIIDHNSVRDFDSIPSQWLEAAIQLTLHYAHTSHGSQIISGILALEGAFPGYRVAVRESGTEGLPPAENPAALRIYDGNPPNTYITPDLYWDGISGMNITRAVAATTHYNFSMWSWCGQQSSNDSETVNRYLTNLNQLETENPEMRFILFTGHTDGSDTPLQPGTLKYNNERVRQYARDHNKIVFDFADIESWDPAGNYYATTTDSCDWCSTWCSNHPSDCQNLTASCAHSHPYNCKLKARAFWYMMARLAGWDGTSSCAYLPVKNSGSSQYYINISMAYEASADGDILQLHNLEHVAELSLGSNIYITLRGGYNCDYSALSGFSTINGSISISGGTVIIENIMVR